MADSVADYLEIRWRVKGSGSAWSAPHRVGVFGDVAVQNLGDSKQYEFEARSVSNCGAKSVWVSSDYTPPGVSAPPQVTSLTAQSLADGVHLGWTFAGQWSGLKFSVERSTSATTGFSECAQVLTTSYTDPETTGTTHYYRVRAQSVMGGYGPYSNVVSSKGVSVDKLGDDIAAAQEAADDAQDSATAALDELADIASDNVLSSAEKPVVIRDYDVITTEQAGIDAQATAYGITTEKTAYDDKVSALTSYLNGLTDPKAWNDKSGNTTIVGTTFRSKFNDVYTTRQTLLNAIYAKAKSLADTAQDTADQANTLITSLPVINGGFKALPLGYGWSADSGTGWETVGDSGTPGVPPNGARRVAGTGSNTGAYRNNGVIGCHAGDVIKAQALIKCVGVTGTGYVFISWLDGSLNEIDSDAGNQISGTKTDGSYVVAAAPTGTVYAKVCLGYSNMTAGTVYADNVVCTQFPSSLDDVPDSSTRYAASEAGADKTAGKSMTVLTDRTADNIDETDARTWQVPGFVNEVVDNAGFELPLYPDGSMPGWEPYGSGVLENYESTPYEGASQLKLTASGSGTFGAISKRKYPVSQGDSVYVSAAVRSGSGHLGTVQILFYNKNNSVTSTYAVAHATKWSTWQVVPVVHSAGADDVYFRILLKNNNQNGGTTYFDAVRCSINDLRVAGSGIRLGNLVNQPAIGYASYGAGWVDANPTYSGTADNMTLTAHSATLQAGSQSRSYTGQIINVTGTAGQTRKYYMYFRDPGLTGGAHVLYATPDITTALADDGNVQYASMDVTFPSSGSGSGSGNGPCVRVDQWIRVQRQGVQQYMQAKDLVPIQRGDMIRAVDPKTDRKWWQQLDAAEIVPDQDGVTVTCANGAELTCSKGALLGIDGGGRVRADASYDKTLWTNLGGSAASMTDAGKIDVVKITCGGVFFVAGKTQDKMLAHHNMKPYMENGT